MRLLPYASKRNLATNTREELQINYYFIIEKGNTFRGPGPVLRVLRIFVHLKKLKFGPHRSGKEIISELHSTRGYGLKVWPHRSTWTREAAKSIEFFFLPRCFGYWIACSDTDNGRATMTMAVAMASYNSVAPAHAINRLSIVNTVLFHFPAILSPFCFRFLCTRHGLRRRPLMTVRSIDAKTRITNTKTFVFISGGCCCCCCIKCGMLRWKRTARV